MEEDRELDNQTSTQIPDDGVDDMDDLFGSEGEEEVAVQNETIMAEDGFDDNLFGEEGEELKLLEEDENEEDEEQTGVEQIPIRYGPPLRLSRPALERPKGQLYFSRLPDHILDIETHPFSREWMEREGHLKTRLGSESVIRWRYAQDAAGHVTKESNARLVRWSDGSLQLMIGGETYDVHEASGANSHLYVKHDNDLLLESHGLLPNKLTFRPASFQSTAHKKLTNEMSMGKYYRERTVKLIRPEADPENEAEIRDKENEERIRAAHKLALEQEKRTQKYQPRPRMSKAFLEEDMGLETADSHRQEEDFEGDYEEDDFIVPDYESESASEKAVDSFDELLGDNHKRELSSESSRSDAPKSKRRRSVLDD